MAGRRNNGEGSIYQRASDGRWVASLTLPQGKRKAFYGNTRKEAADKLKAAIREIENGADLAKKPLTLGAFLDQWLEEVVKPSRRPATYADYARNVKHHLKPYLGMIRLKDLTPQHVQRLLNQKSESGLAPNSVRLIRATLRRALGYALKWGYVTRNVATLVDPPHIVQKPVQPLTAEQVRALLEASRSERLGPLFHVAIATGLRQGELLALRWDDVDFVAGTVRVRHSLRIVAGEPVFDEPKTARSRRVVPLPASALAALREQKDRQAFERARPGDRWREYGLVFTTSIGTPLERMNVTHRLQAILKDAGLPRQRFHDLRHGCATLLLQQGASPRVVMETLGHSTIGVTMNTYAHVMPAVQREAADQLDRLLTGS
jgi:integrase